MVSFRNFVAPWATLRRTDRITAFNAMAIRWTLGTYRKTFATAAFSAGEHIGGLRIIDGHLGRR